MLIMNHDAKIKTIEMIISYIDGCLYWFNCYSAGKSFGSVMFGARSLLEPPPLRRSWFPRNPVGPPAIRPLPRLAGSLKCIDTSTGVTLRPDVLIFSITS